MTEVKQAVERVKASVENKDAKATTLALRDAISRADAYTGEWAEAPNRVVPSAGGNFISKDVSTSKPALTKPAAEPAQPAEKTVEESLQDPGEQDRMKQTILDSLENEGIWAKDAETKKEVA